jgi:hypothetical protein
MKKVQVNRFQVELGMLFNWHRHVQLVQDLMVASISPPQLVSDTATLAVTVHSLLVLLITRQIAMRVNGV